MRYCYILIICIFFIIPSSLIAQETPTADIDITGLWKGILHNDTTGRNLRYEIAISENKGKLSGFSHTFFILDDKEYFGVKRIKVKKEDDKIIVQEVELISNNYPIPPAKGVHQLDVLTLELKDGLMILSGPFTTNRTKEYHPLTGSVHLERKNNYHQAQSALMPHLEELGLSKDLSFIRPEETGPEIVAIAEPVVYAEPIIAKAKAENPGKIVDKEHKAFEVKIKADTAKAIVAAKPAPTKVTVAAPPKTAPVKGTVTTQTATVAVATPAATKPAPVTDNTVTPQPATIPAATVATPVRSSPAPVNTIAPVGKDVATDVNNRTIQTIQSVYYKSDSLELTLYDNGEVDGDTVSVLMNGQVIMPKVGLSTRAVRKTIYITKDMPDSIQLIMYAENLGSIPPNTGLLVVHDGEDIYEIRFSGDYKKNAAIVFRRRKN